MSVYSEACGCQWCANLDAKPCVIIEYLEQRIAALEGRVGETLPSQWCTDE